MQLIRRSAAFSPKNKSDVRRSFDDSLPHGADRRLRCCRNLSWQQMRVYLFGYGDRLVAEGPGNDGDIDAVHQHPRSEGSP